MPSVLIHISLPTILFSSGLLPNLVKAVQKKGYKKPTPIQQKAIPVLLKVLARFLSFSELFVLSYRVRTVWQWREPGAEKQLHFFFRY